MSFFQRKVGRNSFKKAGNFIFSAFLLFTLSFDAVIDSIEIYMGEEPSLSSSEFVYRARSPRASRFSETNSIFAGSYYEAQNKPSKQDSIHSAFYFVHKLAKSAIFIAYESKSSIYQPLLIQFLLSLPPPQSA
ncbi:hypothetical protein EHQ53_10860 [Leptospira langatensis]|uniref:Uncharacterized protein n=1 Tax=Leptospira langatensis TaxID=2484983 RepID=A0A5F1ZU46_9LEPT|nr:hypothetical protein [Leptospira langatensis]TGJ98946.1 hypothetical protein EHO57_15640 [Leptospira langatensis]TGL40485.1 hypothetical protein EHQ53_10860 [Leptospira langatensis]